MVTAIREVEVALGNAEKKLPRQSLIILILCASIWLRLKRSRKVKNSPSAILQLSVRKENISNIFLGDSGRDRRQRLCH